MQLIGAEQRRRVSQRLVDFAVSKGADRSVLIARAGICAGDLEDPDNRAPLAGYLALFEAAIELTGEPALALQFGEAVRMQEISIVGLICEACETTAEVGPQLNRYARLVLDEDKWWIAGLAQRPHGRARAMAGGAKR